MADSGWARPCTHSNNVCSLSFEQWISNYNFNSYNDNCNPKRNQQREREREKKPLCLSLSVSGMKMLMKFLGIRIFFLPFNLHPFLSLSLSVSFLSHILLSITFWLSEWKKGGKKWVGESWVLWKAKPSQLCTLDHGKSHFETLLHFPITFLLLKTRAQPNPT